MPKNHDLPFPAEDESGPLSVVHSICCSNAQCLAAGHRAATGSRLFCSIKSPNGARFRSFVQRNALRVFEVSSLVKRIHTGPPCLALPGSADVIHCVPTLLVEFVGSCAVVEIKRAANVTSKVLCARVAETKRRLDMLGLAHLVLTEADVRETELQQELALLIARRRVSRRFLDGGSVSAWDPFFRSETAVEEEQRWIDAQRACDALLARVMRRDPGELSLAQD